MSLPEWASTASADIGWLVNGKYTDEIYVGLGKYGLEIHHRYSNPAWLFVDGENDERTLLEFENVRLAIYAGECLIRALRGELPTKEKERATLDHARKFEDTLEDGA